MLRSLVVRAVTVSALVLGTVGASSLAGLPPALADPTVTLYASPNGSGTACSQAAPCSLGQAKSNAGIWAIGYNVVVDLYGGTYQLTSTLTFGPSDSGSNPHTVTWQAYNGTPVLSSALTLTGWTPASKPGVWKATVPGTATFRQLYVNGRRATLARSPYNPPGYTSTSTGGYPRNTGAGFTTTPAASLAGWKNPTQIDVVLSTYWTDRRCPVASATSTLVTIAQPCWRNVHIAPPLASDTVTYLENAFELLDQPGEWYFDPTGAVGDGARTVYYKPRPGERMTGAGAVQVTVPTLERLVDIVSPNALQPVHDITFSGTVFADATWLRPGTPDGFATDQATVGFVGSNASPFGYDAMVKTPGAVHLEHTQHINIYNSTFTRLGGTALDIDNSQSDAIAGNNIYDVSGNGIQIGGISPNDQRPDYPPGNETMNILVKDNWVHAVGVEFAEGVGIWAGFVNSVTIDHNEISDLPYTGISIGWGWGYLDNGGVGDGSGFVESTTPTETTDTVAGNNTISHNYIHHVMSTLPDGGAIYTLGAQGYQGSTSHITENYISGEPDEFYDPTGQATAMAHGIYHDNGSQHFDDERNVVSDVPSWLLLQPGYFKNNDGQLHDPAATNNTVSNNWSNQTRRLCICDTAAPSSLYTVANNTFVAGANWPADAAQVVQSAGLEPAYASFLHGSDSRVNLATRGGATVSASDARTGYEASNAMDGSSMTRWTANDTTTAAQLQVTFPNPTTVNRFEFREAQQYDRRIGDYRVEYWDGTTWVPTAYGSYPGSLQVERFPAVTTTAVRLDIVTAVDGTNHNDGRTLGPSVTEVGAYLDAEETNVARPMQPWDVLCSGKSEWLLPSGYPDPQYTGDKACDGSVSTRYATVDNPGPVELVVAFFSSATEPFPTVDGVVLRECTDYGPRVTSYHVDVGDAYTGQWTTVFTSGAPAPVQLDRFPAVQYAIAVRVVVDSWTGPHGPTIADLEVLGHR
jgi:hypothetical protein